MSQKFGIDVSHWQGSFDFARAKSKEGVEFAIIKAGGADAGLYKDSQFEANYKKCEECGLPKGAYFYGNARSVADAKKRQNTSFPCLRERDTSTRSFMMWKAE